jgi:dihydrofolate reductase
MKVSIIVAFSRNRVIGKEGRIPWQIPEDLKWFKRNTWGHKIIMGRKTYESIGRILPGRENIIITGQKNYRVEGAMIFSSLENALETIEKHLNKSSQDEEVFIIGGESLFNQAISLAQKLYITLIHRDFEGDTFFPPIPEGMFRTIFEERYEGDIPFSFIIMEKRLNPRNLDYHKKGRYKKRII